MSDRLDALLEEALASGRLPDELSEAERAELEAALRASNILRSHRPAIEAEAAASLPTARARFQRHLAAARSATPAPATSQPRTARRGLLGRFATSPRLATLGALAAVIVIVAIATLFGPSFFGDGTQDAAAQVLDPGDYVQFQGVVAGAEPDGPLTVTSDFGQLKVDITDQTSLPDGTDGARRPGAALLISGTVAEGRRITATVITAVEDAGTAPPRERPRVELLREYHDGITGRVVTFTVAPNGDSGSVLLATGARSLLLVPVDAASLRDLLALDRAIGAEVAVGPPSARGAAFSLTSVEASPSASGRTGLTRVSGVVLRVEGPTMTIRTDSGDVTVTLRLATRLLPGDSGLRRGDDPTGHQVTVLGVRLPGASRLLAEILIFGPATTP
ncbi:MAG: hypothetical protein ACM3S1_01710 [Hyphomicrobiales bacterium]